MGFRKQVNVLFYDSKQIFFMRMKWIPYIEQLLRNFHTYENREILKKKWHQTWMVFVLFFVCFCFGSENLNVIWHHVLRRNVFNNLPMGYWIRLRKRLKSYSISTKDYNFPTRKYFLTWKFEETLVYIILDQATRGNSKIDHEVAPSILPLISPSLVRRLLQHQENTICHMRTQPLLQNWP